MLKTRVTQAVTGDTMTISGLAGDTEGYYTIIGRLFIPTATAQIVTLRPNGLVTNLFNELSNQWDQTPTRNTTWQLLNITSAFTHSPQLQVDINIEVYAGTAVNSVASIRGYRADSHLMGTATNLESFEIQSTGIWNESSTELTSLVIHSNDASGLIAGSELLVYTPNDTFTP